MTLQQLKYVIEVADKGSINEASKSLFISQPSLSSAIKELEKEIKITIFTRTNRGISISAEGAAFLGYARQVVLQAALLEEKYINGKPSKQKFSVSTHHYLFATNAFVDLIKEFGADEYEFTLRETKTYEVIEDVRNLRSELGIIYLSDENHIIIEKLLKESHLVFKELFTAIPHVFVYKKHPLAGRKSLSLEEIEEYPCLSFEQGEQNAFYFSEEVFSTRSVKKMIKVSDRAAEVNLMIGINAYTISSGVFPECLHGDDIIAIPLEVKERMRVGTIVHRDVVLTRLGEIYLQALEKIAKEIRDKQELAANSSIKEKEEME